MALFSRRLCASNTISPEAISRRLHSLLRLLATALVASTLSAAAPAMAQGAVNLAGGGLYGVNSLIANGDPNPVATAQYPRQFSSGVAASSNNEIVFAGTSGATAAQTAVTLNIPQD